MAKLISERPSKKQTIGLAYLLGQNPHEGRLEDFRIFHFFPLFSFCLLVKLNNNSIKQQQKRQCGAFVCRCTVVNTQNSSYIIVY